jgi:glycosyltransferase involved in cell wall biosynthesis
VTNEQSIHRVLQVHTRYRQTGGEDEAVEAEKRLLEHGGVEVTQVIFDNAELRESESLTGDLGLAMAAIWSRSAERRVADAIAANRPQVMHVHNTFPLASPSVYSAAAARGVPVVQTLHNYRFVCPAATVYRDGRVCTDCVGRFIPWPAVLHACVRDSRPQSAVAAATLAVHRARGTFTREITGYVALTAFQRQLMIDGGLPADRIRVIPNFLEPDPGLGSEDRTGVVFAGRLSPEKGVAVLLDAASAVPGVVRIIGDGPLAPLVEEASVAGHTTFLGSLPRSSVLHELRRSIALVLPSVWFEGFPLVVLEAFAVGTPIIASRIGSLAELIEDEDTGLLVESNNAGDLIDRIKWAVAHPSEMLEMGAKARDRYEAHFRGTGHLAALLEAYAWVGGGRGSIEAKGVDGPRAGNHGRHDRP